MKKQLPEALIPFKFKPGVVTNPGGRPKAIISRAYRKLMSMKLPKASSPEELFQIMFNKIIEADSTYADLMALAQLKQAIVGNVAAAKEIADRIEGKAVLKIEFDEEGTPQIPIDWDLKGLGLVKFRELKALLDEAKAKQKPVPLQIPPVNGNGIGANGKQER